MEPRAFTQQLLARLALPGPAGQEQRPPDYDWGLLPEAPNPCRRILVATDLPAAEALPVWQEAGALRRFGLGVSAMVEPEAGQQLGRFMPPDSLLPAGTPLPGGIWTELEAVLAVPSQDLLARIALGRQDHPVAALVIGGLWRGVPVYMDFSCTVCTGGARCMNPALGDLYQGYRKRVTALGVRPVAPGEYLITLRGAASPEPDPDIPPAAPTGRRVVTQADILGFDPHASQWVLPPGTIITHLARDAARRRGLILRVEEQLSDAIP